MSPEIKRFGQEHDTPTAKKVYHQERWGEDVITVYLPSSADEPQMWTITLESERYATVVESVPIEHDPTFGVHGDDQTTLTARINDMVSLYGLRR